MSRYPDSGGRADYGRNYRTQRNLKKIGRGWHTGKASRIAKEWENMTPIFKGICQVWVHH